MGALHAGAAEVNVTPPVGCGLSGFGGRWHGSVGVHDDLFAKALVLDDGQRRVALVTMDNLGLALDTVAQIRQEVQRRAGIPPEGVMLNSSHTHSGPSIQSLRMMPPREEAYTEELAQKVVGVICWAADNMVEARWGVGREPVQVGINRRQFTPDRGTILGKNPLGPVAPYVDVLRVDRMDGSPLAVLFSHAAHPVSQGGNNYLISADYPGYAMQTVKTLMGGVAMFAQGCCGNINSMEVGASWEVTRRLGVILGAAVVKCAEGIETRPGGRLAAISRTIRLPLDKPPTPEQARAEVAAAKSSLESVMKGQPNPAQVRMAQDLLAVAEGRLRLALEGEQERVLHFELHAIALDDLAFLGMPGEVFVDYALHVDRHSPFAHNFVLGYTNGILGYVPTAYAYPEGGYEVSSSFRIWRLLPLSPDSDPLLRASTLEILRALKDQAGAR